MSFYPTNASNFWSPEGIARRTEIQRQQEADEQALRHAEWMNSVGQTTMSIINSFTANGRPANTSDVQRDFCQVYANATPAHFRAAVDALKQAGKVYEAQGPEGLMGTRETRLHVL
jgi:hypothetical protein